MLTGQLPFEANTPLGIIMKHITQPVPQILDVNPDLPAGCTYIIQKALAKKPEDRFDSVAALAGALHQVPKLNTDVPLQTKKKRTKSKIKRLDAKQPSTETDEIKTGVSVVCPKCNTQNVGQRRLCISCGNRLTLECPLCFYQNQVDAVMCTKCGANLQQLKSQQRAIQKSRKDSLVKREQALRAKSAQQFQEKIMALLDDVRYRRSRTAALHKLDQLLEPAIKTLGGHLMDPGDIETRCQSAIVLGKLYERPEIDMAVKSQIIGVLIDALEAPGQEVRLQIEQLLEDFGNRRSREISNIFKGLVGWIKGD